MHNQILAMYAGFADRISAMGDKCEFAIKFTSSGSLISGKVIGKTKYVELLTEKLKSSGATQEIQKIFLTPIEASLDPDILNKPMGWGQVITDLPLILHLRAVKIYCGSNVMECDLWQATITYIDGFTLEDDS